jgi:5-methylcytosine-specific restriction endonuclease McrA
MSTYGTQRRIKQSTRVEVFERDGYTCQLGYDRCLGQATEIDHVLGVAELGGVQIDDPEWLRAVCRPCHARRNEAQKLAGIKASATRRHDRRKLPSARSTAKHPGDW